MARHHRVRKRVAAAKNEAVRLSKTPSDPAGKSAPRPDGALGQWLLGMIRRFSKKYWELADAEGFKAYFRTDDPEIIADKLTRLCARNASILGACTGVIMSADEIVMFGTGAEGGVGLPANILIAIIALSMEAIVLIRMQLALVAYLGKVYGVALDPDDPADVMTIFAYAIGGSAAIAAGTAGMTVGKKVAGSVAKTIVKKEAMTAMTGVAERLGVRLLQMAVVKYAVPLVSIGIGVIANYVTTKRIGRIAREHLKERLRVPAEGA
jgi:hypothetical protein